ncbi:Glycosyltransferase involved in cell wall bisynthesis [Seinonella peptonophila]|uniref:Glycosyltransferase involved in cell wall bisynthesis n=1 Tax=Seinonella peptonophila TaxID=112248 RepID=A0A1M4UXL4_9BACL|nr:glycosyltransferase family 4 protein [Seinonella peptonophila]SHE61377.1 Glycosyltransferase involved in cell wall bisynthesis [Seinonella peptonophila]
MRVWLANHYAVPPNIAGITRHFELGAEWAKEEETEVTLFTSSFLHPRRTSVTEEEKNGYDKPDRLKVKWLWSFPHKKNDFKRIINMGSFALSFLFSGLFQTRPDVLVASSPHLFTAFSGWMLAKIKRCPFVMEVRDLWPDSLIKMGGLNNGAIISLLNWMESFLYRKADQIIVLTAHQRKFIRDKGIDESKIDLIPNGIVLGSWQHDPERRTSYKRKMGVAESEFVAVYTGAHGPANALEYVVEAGEYLEPGSSIVLIGDGPEKEKLVQLKQSKGLENIHFLDPVPKSEIFNYTEAADCGIISLADNEVFRGARPNKLFDYTFIGQPIITTVDGEVREIVEENQVGFFAGAEDPKGLAQAIKRAKELSVEEREAIKQRGLHYIDREGDRVKLAAKFYRILKNLVASRETTQEDDIATASEESLPDTTSNKEKPGA